MANSRKHPSAHDVTVAIACIEQAIADALRLSPDDQSIAIAFSGGLDSTVLLDAAVAVAGAPRCVAIHIHHGLSPHADEWLGQCEAACERRAVRFAFERLDLRALNGRGVEAAARDARYAALARVAAALGAKTILLGQHADDQAETVLLQLLRGAGLPGLAAMPYERQLEQGSGSASGKCDETHKAHLAIDRRRLETALRLRLLRPFLELDRSMLEAYAKGRQLNWIEDESNADVRYARNALRRDVMPSIDRYFPGYRRTLARTARHAAQAQQLCDDLAEIDLLAVTVSRDKTAGDEDLCADEFADAGELSRLNGAKDARVLSRAALRRLSVPRVLNVLRYWMRLEGLPAASEDRLVDIQHQLCAATRAAQGWGGVSRGQIGTRHITVEILHGGRVLRTYRDSALWTVAEARTSTSITSLETSASSRTQGFVSARAARPAEVGGAAHFEYEGGAVWHLPHWRGELHILDPGVVDPESVSDVTRTCLGIDIDAHAFSTSTLSARARVGGERLRIAVSRPTRSLKQLFQEAEIAPWQRDVPLFYLDDRLFFVPLIGGYLAEGAGHAESVLHSEKPEAADLSSGKNRRIRLVWVAWEGSGEQ